MGTGEHPVNMAPVAGSVSRVHEESDQVGELPPCRKLHVERGFGLCIHTSTEVTLTRLEAGDALDELASRGGHIAIHEDVLEQMLIVWESSNPRDVTG
jgi:hypothetical protein